jgi:hypothetical protein
MAILLHAASTGNAATPFYGLADPEVRCYSLTTAVKSGSIACLLSVLKPKLQPAFDGLLMSGSSG